MSSNFGFKRAVRFAALAKKEQNELPDDESKENEALLLTCCNNQKPEQSPQIPQTEDIRPLPKGFESKDTTTPKGFGSKDTTLPKGFGSIDTTLPSNGTSSPKMPRLKLLKAWQKANPALTNDNDVAKMAKVVTTAKTVDKASKSLLSIALRKRLKDQMRKIAEERLTVKQIFRRYVDTSTLHGFRYTCADTYFIRRFIWAVLMILGAVYFIVKLKAGVIEYYSYPFSTLSTLEYVEKLDFPAISFCTVNQFKYSKVKDGPLLKLQKERRLPFHLNWKDPGYDIPGRELVQEINRTSFQIEDIFKECDYIRGDTNKPRVKPRICGPQNLTSYFSDSGQLCHTLNSGQPGHKLLSVKHEGLKHGFEIMFDLNNDDAVHGFQYSGLQAIVHHQDDSPSSNVGFMLTPGFKTFVRMQRIETKNLPPPYATQCGERKLKYHERYNQKACLLEQLTDYTAEKCKCREPYMPDNGFPYCSLRQKILCAFFAKESFKAYTVRQMCPIDCDITTYTNRISDSRFLHNPPKGIERVLLENEFTKRNITNMTSYLLKLKDQYNQTRLDQYIQENIIVVLFYFGEMVKIVNEQEASFDFYQFLGDMGGEIGLMLGASLLTFVEFLDLFAFLGYHQLLRLNKRKKESESRKQSMIVRNEETANI